MKENAKNNQVVRWLGLLGTAFLLGGISFSLWKLPVQIAAPVFYMHYVPAVNGHPAAYCILAWFLIGGYKTALIRAWDRNEERFDSIRYDFMSLFLVPFVPLLRFKSSWYKLPSIEDMNSKDNKQN